MLRNMKQTEKRRIILEDFDKIGLNQNKRVTQQEMA